MACPSSGERSVIESSIEILFLALPSGRNPAVYVTQFVSMTTGSHRIVLTILNWLRSSSNEVRVLTPQAIVVRCAPQRERASDHPGIASRAPHSLRMMASQRPGASSVEAHARLLPSRVGSSAMAAQPLTGSPSSIPIWPPSLTRRLFRVLRPPPRC